MSLESLKIRLSSLTNNWNKEVIKIGSRLIPFSELADRRIAKHIINILQLYIQEFNVGDRVSPILPSQEELEEWKTHKKMIPYMHNHYWNYVGTIAKEDSDGKVLVDFDNLKDDPGFPNPTWVPKEFIKHHD